MIINQDAEIFDKVIESVLELCEPMVSGHSSNDVKIRMLSEFGMSKLKIKIKLKISIW